MRFDRAQPPRRGLSLIELVIASGLTLLLGSLMVSAWSTFGKPAVEVISRSRIASEITLVTAALTSDLGGGLDTANGRLGPKAQGQLVGWLAPGSSEIWLCYDGGETPNGIAEWHEPDTIVSYSLQSGSLIRWDQTADSTSVVAREVESLGVSNLTDRLRIEIGFGHRNVHRSLSFEVIKP